MNLFFYQFKQAVLSLKPEIGFVICLTGSE